MEHVKFGIIGAGSAWSFHSNACGDSEFIEFTAVYDINYKTARKMARRYRKNEMVPYENLDEMLNSDIDAVLIMVPHKYHEDLVEKAADAGKHILCEKPMAITLEGCDRMIQAALKNGVKLMIAENHRFLPAHGYIHEAVRKGLIGEVTHFRAYEGVNEIAGLSIPDFWKGDPLKAGGGALMDMGAHKFAVLEWILEDQVESVYSLISKQVIPLSVKADDNALSVVRFSKGVIGEVGVSFTQSTPPFNSLEIYGTRGTILENHMWENPVRIFSHDERMEEARGKWFEPELEHAPFPLYYNISVKKVDEHFAHCILEDREPDFAPEQARSAVAGVLMGYLSARQGRPVERPELIDLGKKEGTLSILEGLSEDVPVSKRLKEVKRVEPIGFDKKRAVEAMEKFDLDLLIASSPVNVFYLTGYPSLPHSPNPILYALKNFYPNFALLNREGDTHLLNWENFRSLEEFCWADDHKGILSHKDARNGIWSKIKKWGLTGKRSGLESTAPWFLTEHLARKEPEAERVPADEVFTELRLIKSSEEVRRIEEATRITEAAVQVCLEGVEPGMTDLELLAMARRAITAEGGDGWDHLTMSIGNSDPEAPGTGRRVKKGDMVRFDFGAVYKGYLGDVNRHIVMGPVPDELKSLNDKLILLQEFFEERIEPGRNIRELQDEALAYYRNIYPGSMTLFLGHSIGLECEEAHLFGPMGLMDRPFEENMVFEIEAWEAYGGALIGVEDCYQVVPGGCRKITTLDKNIRSKDV